MHVYCIASDEVGHALAHGKGGSLRGRGGGAAGAPAASGGGLSDAALRMLARNRGGSEARGGTDWDLRRSYATPVRGTPAGSRGATPRATPRATPAPSPAATPMRAAKRPREDAPAAGAAAKPPPGGSITDGLLHL
jgi:hypothetical protein